jgi:hypothetical protein
MMHCFTEWVCVHQTIIAGYHPNSDTTKVYKVCEAIQHSLHPLGC